MTIGGNDGDLSWPTVDGNDHCYSNGDRGYYHQLWLGQPLDMNNEMLIVFFNGDIDSLMNITHYWWYCHLGTLLPIEYAIIAVHGYINLPEGNCFESASNGIFIHGHCNGHMKEQELIPSDYQTPARSIPEEFMLGNWRSLPKNPQINPNSISPLRAQAHPSQCGKPRWTVVFHGFLVKKTQ